MAIYQIPNWDAFFENNKSRDIDLCAFVAMPNKQHGMGLTRILSQPDGAAVFGIWCLILQAASRQPRPRAGWLTDDGKPTGLPWDIEDMALRWRRPVEEVKRALDVLCSPRVGWLKAYDEVPADCRPGAAQVPPKCPSGAGEVPPGCRPGAGEVPPGCRPGAGEVPPSCPSTALEGREGREGREGKEARGGATPTPPVDIQGDNRKRVSLALKQAGLASSEEATIEWVAILRGANSRGKCDTIDEVVAAIGWLGGKIAKGGHLIQFARQAGQLVDEWAQVLAARRKRAEEQQAKDQGGQAGAA